MKKLAFLAVLLLALLPPAAGANGIGTIFVLSPDAGGTATIFERVTHSPVGTANVGENPHGVAFSPDTMKAYVASTGAGHLAVIDRELYETVDRIQVTGAPLHATVSPTGQRVYVTDQATPALISLSVVRSGDRQQFTLDAPGHGVAVSPDDRRVYVTVPGTDTMPSIDPATGQVAARIAVGSGATHVAFSPDAGWLYVLRPAAGSIEVIDPRTDRITTSIAVGAGAGDLAFAPDGRSAYVAGEGPNQITVIDSAAHRVTNRIGLPGGATATGVAADEQFLYLAVPAENKLYVLQRTSLQVVREIQVSGARTVATVPDPFILRVIPRELPNTGSGQPADGWQWGYAAAIALLGAALVARRALSS